MMRIVLVFACLGLASSCLTADATCDSVALGVPVPPAATRGDGQSFCELAPSGRHLVEAGDGGNCPADAGCERYALGELFSEGSSGDAAQCCLDVREGVIVRKFVGRTF